MTGNQLVSLHIAGDPIPQGSKKIGRHGRRPVILDDNDAKLKPWRARVTLGARQAMLGRPPVDAPIELRIVFMIERPRGHYGTGRNAGTLRASAPMRPAVKPDVDKLERAILDALTGVVYVDDGRVVDTHVSKIYAPEPTGAGVLIRAHLASWAPTAFVA
ncbi:RusA family crossover junction endodeoxyribonuclease [Luteipulveratus halotolerans]|uniref:RusA family crossover junction endodeoxyribonuclease n=1 Tax=Luteipulveratus halotolerans TaxID=1631356 RepID=UPI000680D2E8|nr:RusA family crossover junction endodeoxyribonuclease [Luteipulveratus halotolerans]